MDVLYNPPTLTYSSSGSASSVIDIIGNVRKIDDGRGEKEGGRDRERDREWGGGGGSRDGWGEEIWILIHVHVDNRINVATEIFQIE